MMKKSLLFIMLVCSAFSVMATEVPKMLIISTTGGEVEVPVASVKKITYDEAGTTMYVHTSLGTNSYAVANIVRMTLSDGTPSSLKQVQNVSTSLPSDAKIEIEGEIYLLKNGKIFTLEGEEL